MTQIPTLNIASFDTDKTAFIRQFGEAYTEWGFAGITGHAIDTDLVDQALKANRCMKPMRAENLAGIFHSVLRKPKTHSTLI